MKIGSTTGSVNGARTFDALEIPVGTTVHVNHRGLVYEGRGGDYLVLLPADEEMGPAALVPIGKFMFDKKLWEVKP